ncbi:UpxY family transcription antiterminator [Phocaeicola sp.]|uniref:UpxY family transcription antiterminator n=1 Tax=Phocaeicola sp. TaxID=2773926 RepID=UPI004027546B
MDEAQSAQESLQWFAMRDLKRRHAKLPAYKLFENLKVSYFTPMVHRLVVVNGKRVDQEVPFMPDLLFVKDTREHLDLIVESTPKLQYRYKIGVQHTPIIVPTAEMERFIYAVESSENPKFYSLDEVTSEMINRKIRIIGGKLDGYTGTLVTTRGSKVKRLLVELPSLLAASVEVEAEYIQLV